MPRAAARIIRADLISRPVPSILTGIVIAVTAGALLVTLYLRSALDDPFNALSRATNAPHVIVAGPAAEVEPIAQRPGVAYADAPRRVVDIPAAINATEGRVTLAALPAQGRLDHPYIVEGRSDPRAGEVVLDVSFAEFSRLRPGATLTVGQGASRTHLRVVGLGITTMHGATGWVAPETANALAGQGKPVVAIPLLLRDPNSSGAFIAAAEHTVGREVRTGDWRRAREDYTEDSRRLLTILQAATLLALLAAGFTLATSIGGRVIGERRRVGLLRAVGITPRGVTALLVAHYVALAAVAAPVGLAVGHALAPKLLRDTGQALGAPVPGPPGPAQTLGTLALVLGLVALATALPAWRAGRTAPVDALALGRSTAAARASRFAVVARRLRLPLVVALGARDAFARPGRAVLTIASLVLAAVLIVCAMGFEATMNRLASDEALRAQPWDIAVDSTAVAPEQVDRLLRRQPDVAAVARLYEPRLVSPDGRVELAARVLDGPVDQFPFAIRDGRAARAPGEVTLGRGALDALGVHVGDRIRLSAEGAQPFSVRVVGRHVEPDDDGRRAVLPVTSLPESVRRTLDVPSWVVRLRPGADAKAVDAALVRAGHGRIATERPIESLQSEAADMRPIVYGVAALLSAIAAVNLLTTLLLGVRERRRDVAVLGAVGATPGQVVSTVIAGGGLLALLASVAGFPLGALVFRMLVSQTDPADGPDVVTLPAAWWVLLALPVALAATAAVSSLAGRQAARVPVAVALRAE
jgi:putative ABC transport system permease protein